MYIFAGQLPSLHWSKHATQRLWPGWFPGREAVGVIKQSCRCSVHVFFFRFFKYTAVPA